MIIYVDGKEHYPKDLKELASLIEKEGDRWYKDRIMQVECDIRLKI